MKLSTAEIRPGKVLKVVDNYGTIKASCCGLFDATDKNTGELVEAEIENLPPIRPLFKLSPTGFTKPQVDDEIWVWYFKDNPQELFYMFQGDVAKFNGGFLDEGYDDVEVVAKHKISDDKNASQFYDNKNGWTTNYGDTKINLDTEENILIKKNDSSVIKLDDTIHIGKEDVNNPALKGNETYEVLTTIISGLQSIQTAAMGNPITAPIGAALAGITPLLNNIAHIKSNKVYID